MLAYQILKALNSSSRHTWFVKIAFTELNSLSENKSLDLSLTCYKCYLDIGTMTIEIVPRPSPTGHFNYCFSTWLSPWPLRALMSWIPLLCNSFAWSMIVGAELEDHLQESIIRHTFLKGHPHPNSSNRWGMALSHFQFQVTHWEKWGWGTKTVPCHRLMLHKTVPFGELFQCPSVKEYQFFFLKY